MSDGRKVTSYLTLDRLAKRIRADLEGRNFTLLYAFNRTGKTRLSMEFKKIGKAKNNGAPDTLYFNAFTEDLFTWENDLENDSERHLRLNSDSSFFDGLKELDLNPSIEKYLNRYTDLQFDLDYDGWKLAFSRSEMHLVRGELRQETVENIKISRGEENLFIWCMFMAICERLLDGDEAFEGIRYLYIDDPISSLDDNNAIQVGCDLARLLKRAATVEDANGNPAPIKVAFSSHHSLFYNIVCRELSDQRRHRYFLYRAESEGRSRFCLRRTEGEPYFHHIANLAELQRAADTGEIFTYHFNGLRNVFEKTASFFGQEMSFCLRDAGYEEAYFNRAVQLLSHGGYSVYEPREMGEDNKDLFRKILTDFLTRFQFEIPEILGRPPAQANTTPTT